MKHFLPFLAVIAAATSPALAQAPDKTAPKTNATPDKTAPATQTAKSNYAELNSSEGQFDDTTGVSILTKDVTVTQSGEDFILYAQRVVYSRPKNQATAFDQLRIETRQSTIRGTRLFGDFDTKVLSVIGDVVVTSYGEDDGVQTPGSAKKRAEEKRKPVKITCDRLDWNYDTRQATLVGSILMTQEENVGTCDKIIYDETKNAAQLIGNVRFGNAKKQQFLGDDLVVFVDTSRVQTNKGIRVIGPVDNIADEKPKTAPKPTTAFPEPATPDETLELPAPPPDIDTFLPKANAPKAAATPKGKPAPKTTPTPKETPIAKEK